MAEKITVELTIEQITRTLVEMERLGDKYEDESKLNNKAWNAYRALLCYNVAGVLREALQVGGKNG